MIQPNSSLKLESERCVPLSVSRQLVQWPVGRFVPTVLSNRRLPGWRVSAVNIYESIKLGLRLYTVSILAEHILLAQYKHLFPVMLLTDIVSHEMKTLSLPKM